jgi:hypothetical protein
MRRRFFAVGLMVLFGGLPAISCGGGYEAVHTRSWRREGRARAEAPPEVTARMEGCVRRWEEQLLPAEYPVQLGVRLDEDGRVYAAEVERSTVRDAGLERCLVGALMGTSFAGSVPGLRGGGPPAGGTVSAEARGLFANPGVLVAPAVAAAGVALSPVVITVGLLTLSVVLIVYMAATSEDAESERERCRKVMERCIDECYHTLPTGAKHGMPHHKCVKDCREAEGCWKALN